MEESPLNALLLPKTRVAKKAKQRAVFLRMTTGMFFANRLALPLHTLRMPSRTSPPGSAMDFSTRAAASSIFSSNSVLWWPTSINTGVLAGPGLADACVGCLLVLATLTGRWVALSIPCSAPTVRSVVDRHDCAALLYALFPVSLTLLHSSATVSTL